MRLRLRLSLKNKNNTFPVLPTELLHHRRGTELSLIMISKFWERERERERGRVLILAIDEFGSTFFLSFFFFLFYFFWFCVPPRLPNSDPLTKLIRGSGLFLNFPHNLLQCCEMVHFMGLKIPKVMGWMDWLATLKVWCNLNPTSMWCSWFLFFGDIHYNVQIKNKVKGLD